MSHEVTCPACGHANPLGRMFCMSCGARLELSEKTVRQARERGMRGSGVSRFIRLLVFLAALAALVAMLRPVSPAGATGGTQDSASLARKLNALQQAQLEHRSLHVIAEESEVNAYLQEALEESRKTQGGGSFFELTRINVAFAKDELTVLLVAERGQLTVTQELRGAPVIEGGRFALKLTSVRVGQLPLPGAAGRLLAGRAAVVFSGMSREREVLGRSWKVETILGKARIQTIDRQGGEAP